MAVRTWMKRLLCVAALLCLCSCSVLEALPAIAPAADTAQLPDLRQLEMPAAEPTAGTSGPEAGAAAAMQVDLWLDASQVMGGINPDPDSLYPHRSKRYREGGFHYRYEGQVGWYENVLRDLLAAAEGSRVRILRNGNERISDDQLLTSGLLTDTSQASLRSLRRDLLTYAIDPMPSLFQQFSAESMEGSFYSLYSPQMNQMAQLGDGSLLENPGRTEGMSAFLDSLIQGYRPRDYQATLRRLLTDDFSPLLQALDNLDPSRLSVITCDPLTLRRLSGTAVDGTPVHYLEQIVRERGLFDQGLTVSLYAFQLDYLGQITTIGDADLSQPFIWGRLDYISYKNQIKGPLPMPRTLLTLIIGTPDQVSQYTQVLNARLDSNAALRGLRGPDAGQLTYSLSGATITQQPFTFAYYHTDLKRHSVDAYTQSGSSIQITQGQGKLMTDAAQPTVALASDQTGPCQVTITWPVKALEGGLRLDSSQLSQLRISGVATLLLQTPVASTPDYAAPPNVQTLKWRSSLYPFAYTEDVPSVPFTAESLTLSEDGTQLIATISCQAQDLTPGYYRLNLRADITGEQLTWPKVGWLDALNATVTNEQFSLWEQMADTLDEYSRYSSNVPSQFWHAWGETSGKVFREMVIPDCPPVYAAPRLSELVTQLQNAAQIDSLPFVSLQMDVFVAPADQL